MVGAVLQDGSAAVLAADSMTKMATPPGYRLRNKILEFARGGSPGGVLISSPGWVEAPPPFGSLKDVARGAAILAAQSASLVAADPNGRLWKHDAQVMLAGWAWSIPPAAPLVLGHGDQWASRGGASYLGGTAAIWARETGQPELVVPQTMEAAEELCADIATRTIEWWYREDDCASLDDYLARGMLPPIAPPIHTATLRADSYSIERKEWQCLTLSIR